MLRRPNRLAASAALGMMQQQQPARGAQLVVNDLDSEAELRIVITAAGTDSGKLLIIAGAVPKQTKYNSDATLTKENALITSSLGAGSFAELTNFLNLQNLVIDEMRIQASGTNGADNYEGYLVLGELRLDGTIKEKRIEFTDYRKEVNTGFNSVLEIVDNPIVVTPRTFLALSNIKANTVLTLRCKVRRMAAGALVNQLS